MDEFKKDWLPRILVGALLGLAAYLAGVWVLDAMPWMSHIWSFHNPLRVWRLLFYPSPLEGVLDLLLWAVFGAEVAVATLPFADTGREVVARSLLHFAVTALTVGVWTALNFGWREIPLFLFLLAVGYLLIWITRWVGWYSEIADIRERLGLVPAPSFLKWREVLPYLLLLGAVYGFAMPILGIFDGHIPFFTGFVLPYIVYPILAGAVGFHTGKHCGFTILVPLAVYPLALLSDFWLWLAKVLNIANMAYGYVTLGLAYAAIALVCHGVGTLVRRGHGKAEGAQLDG